MNQAEDAENNNKNPEYCQHVLKPGTTTMLTFLFSLRKLILKIFCSAYCSHFCFVYKNKQRKACGYEKR